jgi:peptidoglycan hydrolase-like protein with peptidoglycan-binding domain
MAVEAPQLKRTLHGAVGGEIVRRVQVALRELGFDPGEIDGIYGPITARAVRAFQEKSGLPADGRVGAESWESLVREAGEVLGGVTLPGTLLGATGGEDVRWLQSVLAEGDHDPGPIDGVYGPLTERAVLAFQRAESLHADGVVGTKTWERLVEMTSGGRSLPPASVTAPSISVVIVGHGRDEGWATALRKLLVEREGDRLRVFSAADVPEGESWAAALEQVSAADLVLVLLSPAFLSSSWAQTEVQTAIERTLAQETTLIPILVESVEWADSPFARFQALPRDGRPMNQWPDREAALSDVSQGILQVVARIREGQPSATSKGGPEAWAPSSTAPRSTFAGFSPDRIGDEDHLGRQEMVNVICRVLAAKNLEPPLAIGLFGDWGSGKSTFMRQMQRQIAKLSEASALAEAESRQTAYCSHIRQVDFNAWQYSDSDNLWPSLAAQVFRSVAGVDPEALKSTREAKRLHEFQQRADPKYRELINKREEAVTEESATREELNAIDRQIPELKSEVVGRAAELGPEAREAVERGEDLRKALSAGRQIRHGWRTLSGSAWLFIATALLVGIGATIASIVQPSWITSLIAIGGGVVSVVGFLSRALGFVAQTIQIDERVRGLEKQRERTADRLHAAAARREETDAALRSFPPGPLLPLYALDQADQWTGREHLGVVSEIRQAFARLSEMVTKSRDARAKGEDGAVDQAPLDRVIVYIDDLDRCQAPLVVQILEAIKLLMDLPHFVVIVGVDSRWLFRSLEIRFREELGLAGVLSAGADADRAHWAATPQNYLEKIFQFSVMLPPMSAAGYARLVESLFPTVERKATERPVERTGKVRVGEPQQQWEQQLRGGAPSPEEPDLTPSDLLITREEREFMQSLAPLIETPRSAKRLANIYRLLRVASGKEAVLTDRAYEAILTLLGIVIGFPRLARDVFGAIAQADPATSWQTLVEELHRTAPGRAPVGGSTDDPRAGDPNLVIDAEGTGVWDRLAARLEQVRLGGSLSRFQDWVPSVAGFTFQPWHEIAFKTRN